MIRPVMLCRCFRVLLHSKPRIPGKNLKENGKNNDYCTVPNVRLKWIRISGTQKKFRMPFLNSTPGLTLSKQKE